jgi:hypothetical protein
VRQKRASVSRFPPCGTGGSLLQKWSKRSRFICASQLVQITSRCFPASTVFRNNHLWRETLCLQGKSISGGATATHHNMRGNSMVGQAIGYSVAKKNRFASVSFEGKGRSKN